MGLRQVLLKGKNLDAILNIFSVVFLLELEYLQFFYEFANIYSFVCLVEIYQPVIFISYLKITC